MKRTLEEAKQAVEFINNSLEFDGNKSIKLAVRELAAPDEGFEIHLETFNNNNTIISDLSMAPSMGRKEIEASIGRINELFDGDDVKFKLAATEFDGEFSIDLNKSDGVTTVIHNLPTIPTDIEEFDKYYNLLTSIHEYGLEMLEDGIERGMSEVGKIMLKRQTGIDFEITVDTSHAGVEQQLEESLYGKEGS